MTTITGYENSRSWSDLRRAPRVAAPALTPRRHWRRYVEPGAVVAAAVAATLVVWSLYPDRDHRSAATAPQIVAADTTSDAAASAAACSNATQSIARARSAAMTARDGRLALPALGAATPHCFAWN